MPRWPSLAYARIVVRRLPFISDLKRRGRDVPPSHTDKGGDWEEADEGQHDEPEAARSRDKNENGRKGQRHVAGAGGVALVTRSVWPHLAHGNVFQSAPWPMSVSPNSRDRSICFCELTRASSKSKQRRNGDTNSRGDPDQRERNFPFANGNRSGHEIHGYRHIYQS